MERRKHQIGRVSTGKRSVPTPQSGDGITIDVGVHVSVKPFIPKPVASSSTSGFLTPQPLPESSSVVEYNVRVPKVTKKQHCLMRFNGALNVDFSKWTNVRMQREDNSHLHKLPDFPQIEMPKFGAGSEYGRDQREEARLRKYGMYKKKYKRENQPWVLKAGTADMTRKFKGIREGGVNENASYFIFTQAPDGCFEVFPIKDWFNFTPVQRYKALSAEEAEEQFSKRSKILNLFSVMVQKRMREDKEDVEDEKAEKGSKSKKSDMQVTEMDDWIVEEMEDDDDSDEETEEKEKKPKNKKPAKKEKKKDESDDDLDLEDSDDGDEEGREQDYMTDVSSDSDMDDKKPELPGIDQDDNLRSLLESGSSSEDEGNDKKKEEEEEEEAEAPEGNKKKKSKKKKKSEKKPTAFPDVLALVDEAPSEDNVDTKPEVSSKIAQATEVKIETTTSKEETNPLKRKAVEQVSSTPKKPKVDLPSSILQLAASEGITEEAVKKYLLRKPMTIAELLQKFKPKKSKISSNDLVPVIAHILKKLNPAKRSLSNKTYFFINNKP